MFALADLIAAKFRRCDCMQCQFRDRVFRELRAERRRQRKQRKQRRQR